MPAFGLTIYNLPSLQILAVKERSVERRSQCGQFLDENITEIERRVVRLQLDLAAAVNGFVPLPVVFHDHMVHHQNFVQIDGHALVAHDDVKRVPLADRFIGFDEGFARIFLIVVQAAGALWPLRGIPYLHLRSAAQINAAVAPLFDLPIHHHFEIGIVAAGAQALAFTIEIKDAVDRLPVLAHLLIGFDLRPVEFIRIHSDAFDRIFHQPLPSTKILAVEQGGKAFWGLILCAGEQRRLGDFLLQRL
ncbi:MAG: hypothetical protein BWY83_03288 [bacterium ADurb.Bin478]|nr:MAG: hypothetical protein BWY83_03288 [bacterium ADurb.Bin478]